MVKKAYDCKIIAARPVGMPAAMAPKRKLNCPKLMNKPYKISHFHGTLGFLIKKMAGKITQIKRRKPSKYGDVSNKPK